jgi:hypothetical protein
MINDDLVTTTADLATKMGEQIIPPTCCEEDCIT